MNTLKGSGLLRWHALVSRLRSAGEFDGHQLPGSALDGATTRSKGQKGAERRKIGEKVVAKPNGQWPFELAPRVEANGQWPFELAPRVEADGQWPFELAPRVQANGQWPFELAPRVQAFGQWPFELAPQQATHRLERQVQ